MTATTAIIEALIGDRRVAPLELLGLPEAADFDAGPYAFLGTRRVCGSMMTVAVVRADGLAFEAARTLHARFYGLARKLEPYADQLVGSRLGAMGVAIFVFEQRCPDGMADRIRRLRLGSLSRDMCVAYVVEAATGRVWLNRGLPLCFAGRSFLRRALLAGGARGTTGQV